MWYLSGMGTDRFLKEAREKQSYDRIERFLDKIPGALIDLNMAAESMGAHGFPESKKALVKQFYAIQGAQRKIERIYDGHKASRAREARRK